MTGAPSRSPAPPNYNRVLSAWRQLALPGSFASVGYFKRGAADKKGLGLSRRQLEELLDQSRLYQETRRPRLRLARRRTAPAFFFGSRWEADQVDLGLGGRRTGHPRRRYVLLAVDVFSRRLFARALPDKKAGTTADAFDDILRRLKPPYGKPQRLETDKGKEFWNKVFMGRARDHGIRHRLLSKPQTARYAERAVRSFKRLIVAYLRSRGKPEKDESAWQRAIARAIDNLNGRFHRSLGMAPDDVPRRWREVQRRLVLREAAETTDIDDLLGGRLPPSRYREGDVVLAVKPDPRLMKRVGRKESDPAFETGPHTVSRVLKERRPYLYALRDPRGRPVRRLFYARQLRPAGRRLRRRTRRPETAGAVDGADESGRGAPVCHERPGGSLAAPPHHRPASAPPPLGGLRRPRHRDAHAPARRGLCRGQRAARGRAGEGGD